MLMLLTTRDTVLARHSLGCMSWTGGMCRVLRTEGDALRFRGVSGGCNNGEAARGDLEAAAAAWYSGREGVDALDMLAWPRSHCCACAALERGLSVDGKGGKGPWCFDYRMGATQRSDGQEEGRGPQKECTGLDKQRC